jgi:threonylcarbamoyladenosine tRNA methylthiotransferase MtaB
LIKIQSGCLNYCSYCIVPLVRKRIVNRPSQDIIYEILRRQKQGFKEVVLVGTNISTYFCPNSKITLTGLLEKILVETSIERIRLSSFWPTHLEKKLINLIAEQPRLCNHLHLSIQSASNSVLKQMNRNYTEEDLDKIISQLKKNKDLNLSADFIVGFPGETNLDFKKTKKLVKRAKFLKIHVFRFSKRPGTKAEQMKESISEKEKQKRSKALITVGDKISRKRRKYFINQSRMVLFENKRQGYWQGFTENYLKVFVENKNNLKNQIIRVKLKKVFKDGIIGQINAF